MEGEWSNIIPQWPDSNKWRGMVKYCTSVSDLIAPKGELGSNIVPQWSGIIKWRGYDQILYLSDLIAPNGEEWWNIVPQRPDRTKWRGMVKYGTSVTWYYQMERYDQILYFSDLIVPKGKVWSNIIPHWLIATNSNKWRCIVKYCTSVTW